MVCEVKKMQDFDYPHVMSLIGVCLDASPGIAIVMPYMTNGSLLDYLKRERSSLELDDDCDIDQVCSMLHACGIVIQIETYNRIPLRLRILRHIHFSGNFFG